MKTTKTTVVLLFALVLLTVAATQPVVAMEKPKISNTRTASCLVKITSDPSVLPLSDIAVDYLLRSSGVAGKAARDILDISPDIASELFIFEDIEKMFPSSAGVGIPPDYQLWASTYGNTTTSRSTRPTTPTAARTPTPSTRTPTARTSHFTTQTTTPTRRTTTSPTPRLTTTVTQPLSSTTEQTILFKLEVNLSEEFDGKPIKPAAEEFMIALIDNLRSALRGAFDKYHSKLDGQLDFAEEEAIRAQNQLVDMQAKLRVISGSRDLSRPVILRNISELRQKLQSAKMKRASDEKLYEATAKRIAEEQARRKKLVEDDPITRELKSILDVHEKRLKDTRRRYEAGEVPVAEIENVREKIIRARIELAKRQEEVSNPPGSIVLSSLSDDLAALSTKVVVAAEEIRVFGNQLEEAEHLLRIADDYELLSLKADIARQNLEETLLWHARLGRNARSIRQPDVTVIGAE